MNLGIFDVSNYKKAGKETKQRPQEEKIQSLFPEIEWPKAIQLLVELNKTNKEEYEKWLYKKSLVEKIMGKSTLIIGVKAKDGVVLGADRKVMRGGESDFENKVSTMKIKDAPIMFAAAGMVGIIEDLLETFEETLTRNIKEGKIDSLLTVKWIAEQSVEMYGQRYAPKFVEHAYITFILGGLSKLTTGETRLYKIGYPGYGEIIKHYSLIGHGEDYARTIGKYLFPRHPRTGVISLPCNEIISRIAACIYWVGGEIDDYVGGDPQVVYMIDNKPAVLPGKYSKEQISKKVGDMKKDLKEINFSKKLVSKNIKTKKH